MCFAQMSWRQRGHFKDYLVLCPPNNSNRTNQIHDHITTTSMARNPYPHTWKRLHCFSLHWFSSSLLCWKLLQANGTGATAIFLLQKFCSDHFSFLVTVKNHCINRTTSATFCILASTIVSEYVSRTKTVLKKTFWDTTLKNVLPKPLHACTMSRHGTPVVFKRTSWSMSEKNDTLMLMTKSLLSIWGRSFSICTCGWTLHRTTCSRSLIWLHWTHASIGRCCLTVHDMSCCNAWMLRNQHLLRHRLLRSRGGWCRHLHLNLLGNLLVAAAGDVTSACIEAA